MLVFLSGVAVLVAVGAATRRAQRDDEFLGIIPGFRVAE